MLLSFIIQSEVDAMEENAGILSFVIFFSLLMAVVFG